MLKGLYILNEKSYEKIYGPEEREDIAKLVDIYAPLQTSESIMKNPSVLKEADVIFSGWGAPKMDEEFISYARNLRAVFYGAGSVKGIVSDAFWDKGIIITSAYAANAIPVAEYTLSQILFSLKKGWQFALSIKKERKYPTVKETVPGAYKSIVGIVSLGMVARRVCNLLKNFDLKVIAYDPFVSEEEAAKLGVELCSLKDIFRRADVVSLHTPWLKETEGMITGIHFESMKSGATFINTARGAVVREHEMIDVLKKRPDLQAILDVTYPEPPEEGSLLYTLPNVILTPHIAGSMDRECNRMGRYMVEELERYIKGEPLNWQISRERAAILA